MPDVAPVPPSDGAARDALLSLLVVLLTVGVALWPGLRRQLGPSPSADRCSALVQTYVQHQSRARDPKVRSASIDIQVDALVDRPALQRQLLSCEQALAPKQIDCALDAPNVDELERCLQ